MILNDSAKIVVDLAGDIETGNKIIESLEAGMVIIIYVLFCVCKAALQQK